MNKKLYKMICANYNKTLDKDLYEMYEEALKDYQDHYIEDAIKYIIENDKYMPTLARIKEVVKDLPSRELTEDEKIEKWKKKNIVPAWLDRYLNLDGEKLSPSELQELEKEMSMFR